MFLLKLIYICPHISIKFGVEPVGLSPRQSRPQEWFRLVYLVSSFMKRASGPLDFFRKRLFEKPPGFQFETWMMKMMKTSSPDALLLAFVLGGLCPSLKSYHMVIQDLGLLGLEEDKHINFMASNAMARNGIVIFKTKVRHTIHKSSCLELWKNDIYIQWYLRNISSPNSPKNSGLSAIRPRLVKQR